MSSLTPLKSSNLAGYRYSPETKELVIEFRNGGRYAYDDVSPDTVQELAGAESPGRFFMANIRGRPARKVEAEKAEDSAPAPAKEVMRGGRPVSPRDLEDDA